MRTLLLLAGLLLGACLSSDSPAESGAGSALQEAVLDPCSSVLDSDGDGRADACDPCPIDPLDDSDGDTVCDSDDLCQGSNDLADSDGDGLPDGCDTEDCSDGLDNNGNGLVDTDDAPCIEGPEPPAPKLPPCPGVEGVPTGVQFAEVSVCAGIDDPVDLMSPYLGTAQALGDANADCHLDLLTADPSTEASLFLGAGDGTFSASENWLPEAIDQVGGAVFVDYDNDGLRDLHLLRLGPDVLLRNTGTSFVDVTASAGIGASGMSQGAAWGYFDGDGDLDAYVVAWLCNTCPDPVTGQVQGTRSNDSLFRNEGDGTFSDVSNLLEESLSNGAGYAASWSDLDGDGDLDLLVANDKGYPGPPLPGAPINRNVHFRNDGPGCDGWCFEEIGNSSGFGLHMDGMGIAIADFDLDLDFDVLVSDSAPPVLLEQIEGDLVDVSLVRDTGTQVSTGEEEGWGLHWFDADNDGCLDFYEAVGPSSRPPHDHMRRSSCTGMFVDATELLQLRDPYPCYGTARADYDNDGQVDFVVGCDVVGHRLYRNLGDPDDNHWVKVRLTGGHGVNMDAVGAQILLVDTQDRQHLREVRIGSSLGANHELTQHFGLGSAQVVSITITWPDGVVDPVGAVDVGQTYYRSRTQASN